MSKPAPIHPTLILLPDEIRSERVVLRPLRSEDAEAAFAAIDEAREHLRPWMDWVDKQRTVDDVRDYCLRTAGKWILRTDLAMGMFAVASGAYLGGTGLHDPDWELRRFEIGYWIRPSAEGHGFVSEAVRLLSRLAFDDLGARRLEIRCDATNDRSRRVAERAGFLLEGRLRNEALAPDGEPRDTLVFSLIPADYERLRAESASG